MRILHFSDIHLQQPWAHVPLRDWLGRRLFGGLNLLLGRQQVFADAHRKVAALGELGRRVGVDFAICSGDFTALGTAEEVRRARLEIEPLTQARLGWAAVPGNHDLYTLDPARERRFLEHFGDATRSDLPEYQVGGGPFPFVRFVGDTVAVVGMNSARPDLQPWRATGRIPTPHLDALALILEEPRLRARFVLVVAHHAPCLEDGRPDRWSHRMVNAGAFLDVCSRLRRGAILCGHVHRRYACFPESTAPVLCAGSATHRGREGLWVLEVEGERARGVPGRWEKSGYVLEPEAAVSL